MIDEKENELINCKLRTLYRQYEEEFLDIWEEARKTTDPQPRPVRLNEFGIVDPQRYDADHGVLFIGRELNGWKDEDIRKGCMFLNWMRGITRRGAFAKNATPNMWYNIGRWAMLIHDPECDILSLEKCKGDALSQIGTIAFTNVNKVWGSSKIDKAFYKLVKNELVTNLLRCEIEIIKPKMIVCCGTQWLVQKAAPDYTGDVIAMPHPGARTGTLKMLNQLKAQLSGTYFCPLSESRCNTAGFVV